MESPEIISRPYLLAISIAIAEIKEPYMSHYGVLYVFFVGSFSYFNNLPIQKNSKNI